MHENGHELLPQVSTQSDRTFCPSHKFAASSGAVTSLSHRGHRAVPRVVRNPPIPPFHHSTNLDPQGIRTYGLHHLQATFVTSIPQDFLRVCQSMDTSLES